MHDTRNTTLDSLDWAKITVEVRRAILARKMRASLEYLESRGDTADDLVQSALLNLIENFASYNPDKASIETYASIRARQTVLERLKYWNREMRNPDGGEMSLDYRIGRKDNDELLGILGKEDDRSALVIDEQAQVVRHELGERIADVFIRTYRHGHDQRMIAQAIGLSGGRVSQLHLMALSVIREKGELVA